MQSFTDFMIECMQGEDEVSSAFVILRRSSGFIAYKPFNQEVADSLGMLRFAQISLESDLVKNWSGE